MGEKKIFESDVWQHVPMVSQELLDMGFEGGESCQATPYLIFDPIDSQLGFFGTDCAGLYRTLDGGNHWHMCTLGMVSCGAVGFAIDANNINRVIFVGANTWRHYGNGIHLSTDKGDTWRYVYTVEDTGHGQVGIHIDRRNQTAFDTTTYDEKIGGSAVAYWSREYSYRHSYAGKTRRGNVETSYPAIYRSDDGGEHWSEIPDTFGYGGGDLAVNAENGWVYVSVNHDLKEPGVYRSKDRGEHFEKVLDVEPLSMDTIRTHPNNIYVSTREGIYISEDAGDTWRCVKGENYPTFCPERLRVSPADPDNMLVFDNHSADPEHCWSHKVYFTRDGGKTWGVGDRDATGLWVPANSWDGALFAFTQRKGEVFAASAWKSVDGGEHFYYSLTGFNGICVGGKYNWNANTPNIMALSSQDFNGGYTLDNGRTWTYVNWSGKPWGGHTYCSYMFDENNGAAGVAQSWAGGGVIRATHDGGKTVVDTGYDVVGNQVACGVPGDPDVAFLGGLRTADRGYTFEKMENCMGVYTFDPNTAQLFGANGQNLVISDDKGLTWRTVYAFTHNIMDIAYNHIDKTIHVVLAGGHYYRGKNVEHPGFRRSYYGSVEARAVCVDPVCPNIVYIGCCCHEYTIDSVMRSLDDGDSFTCLNRKVGDGRQGLNGGVMTSAARVNPNTRELFTSGGCRGVWKLPAPPVPKKQ